MKDLVFQPYSNEVVIHVEGRKTNAKVANKEYCILGLKYLQESGILIRCNFRPENSTFLMIFTE